MSQLFQIEGLEGGGLTTDFPVRQPRRGHHEIHEIHESFATVRPLDPGEAFVFFVVYLPSVAVEDRPRCFVVSLRSPSIERVGVEDCSGYFVVAPPSWLRLCCSGSSVRQAHDRPWSLFLAATVRVEQSILFILLATRTHSGLPLHLTSTFALASYGVTS